MDEFMEEETYSPESLKEELKNKGINEDLGTPDTIEYLKHEEKGDEQILKHLLEAN